MKKISKKVISIFLIVLLIVSSVLISATAVHASESTYKLGDANIDGSISIKDVSVVQKCLAQSLELEDFQLYLADVDGSSTLGIRDATYLQLYVAKKDITYPVNSLGYTINDELTFEEDSAVPNGPATTASTTKATTASTTKTTTASTTKATTNVTTATQSTTSSKASPKKTLTVSGTVAYTLKGLNPSRAVQNFYVGSTYIYITQRVDSTTYLSRLLIDESAKTATYVDRMTLKNAGHGQSLDMITYNGINYLYVGCKPETYSSSYYFSLQAARLVYKAGATYDYTDLNRCTYMNYANKTAKKLGTTYRVAVGGNNSYTIFRIQTEEGSVTYSIYDTVKLNKLLDASQSVRMDSSGAKSACVKSFTQSGNTIIRPNSSFQGVDMIDKDRIYLTGGADGDTPQMAYMSSIGQYVLLAKITNFGTPEIEGLQCKDGRLYFLIIPDTSNKKNGQKICYLDGTILD